MDTLSYMSVKDAAQKFEISERRVQKLCEEKRISGVEMISGVWVIPADAIKPSDERIVVSDETKYITLNELCDDLSISVATGKNWVKLGKLMPDHIEKKTPIFTREYTAKLKQDIQSGKNGALKSRRNKKFVSGNALYNAYVSDKCIGILPVKNLLEKVGESGIELTLENIRIFVADVALRLFLDRLSINYLTEGELLPDFLKGKLTIGKFDSLILDLIENKKVALSFYEANKDLFEHEFHYEAGEDVLGLLYISCANVGLRKATGSYYTPTTVVKRLIQQINIEHNTKVMDPCCGTGNFLMQLPDNKDFNTIYGTDIDEISVKIARINMALKYPDASVADICSHIIDSDYLDNGCVLEMDYIIGNPPWGFEYSEDDKKRLKERFGCASGKNVESYDVFIEQALNNLKVGGCVFFVLPEAFLNVKAHTPIREKVIQESSIKYLSFLGNIFDGVNCPCIILGIEHTGKAMSTVGLRVNNGKRIFVIDTERKVFADYFSFDITDEEYKVLEKLEKKENFVYLKDSADFALGIVTGNNKKYISKKKTEDNEVVLKGSDICKYKTKDTDNYIVFRPEKFQQVAPTSLYRSNEKLLYRFICNQLVFAYDDKQTLSLNSCNILIPKIEGINIKYVMAILNSRVAQFIYSTSFNSVKILRSHIENIPIPRVNTEVQDSIIKIVDKLLSTNDMDQVNSLYELIDDRVCELYGLSEDEKKLIKDVADQGNKFLQ